VAAYQKTMDGQPVTGIADRATQQAVEAEISRRIFDDPATWLVGE
jgi:hypothetical protein